MKKQTNSSTIPLVIPPRSQLTREYPRVVFQHTGHAEKWEIPNALATDEQGHWFLCSAVQEDTDAPRSECEEVSLLGACEWYIKCDPFSLDSTGSLVPLLKDIAAVLRKQEVVNG